MASHISPPLDDNRIDVSSSFAGKFFPKTNNYFDPGRKTRKAVFFHDFSIELTFVLLHPCLCMAHERITHSNGQWILKTVFFTSTKLTNTLKKIVKRDEKYTYYQVNKRMERKKKAWPMGTFSPLEIQRKYSLESFSRRIIRWNYYFAKYFDGELGRFNERHLSRRNKWTRNIFSTIFFDHLLRKLHFFEEFSRDSIEQLFEPLHWSAFIYRWSISELTSKISRYFFRFPPIKNEKISR